MCVYIYIYIYIYNNISASENGNMCNICFLRGYFFKICEVAQNCIIKTLIWLQSAKSSSGLKSL